MVYYTREMHFNKVPKVDKIYYMNRATPLEIKPCPEFSDSFLDELDCTPPEIPPSPPMFEEEQEDYIVSYYVHYYTGGADICLLNNKEKPVYTIRIDYKEETFTGDVCQEMCKYQMRRIEGPVKWAQFTIILDCESHASTCIKIIFNT